MTIKLSRPNVIRRFIAGETPAEIAKEIGCSRNHILGIVQVETFKVFPEAGLKEFGPLTEARVLKILCDDRCQRRAKALAELAELDGETF